LLDEDTPHAIRDQLLRRQPDIEVLVVGDGIAPDLGTPDREILKWIEGHACVLVSRNRRTIPGHLREHLAAGDHVPGIFLLRRGYSLGAVIEDLLLIWEAGSPEEFGDRAEYLPWAK
jgi:hypothetical protein